MKLTKALCITGLLAFSVSAFAIGSPATMLEKVSNKVIAGLAKNKSKLKSNPKIAYDLVVKYIVPVVNVKRMSGEILGRSYWRKATASQRKDLAAQLQKLVASTYADAFSSYDDDKIKFYPLRQDYKKRSAIVVKSMIMRRNGQKISVVYNVAKQGDKWRVYDFSIENVSMVQSYRSQFASTLQQGGVSLLLQRLQKHNQRRK